MVSDIVFCKEMYEVKAVIAGGKTSSKATAAEVKDDLILQYPESISEMELGNGETFTREIAINRRLRSITVSCPEDTVVVLKNDNQTFLWFTDEAGNEKFPHGKFIGTLKIEVSNSGSVAARWLCRMVFD